MQKLTYYAQAWTHAYTGEVLFDADFRAWRHGPVIPDVYRRYKAYGFKEIDKVDGGLGAAAELSIEQRSILDWVWDKYSKFEAKFLEGMTHQERPWR